MQQKNTYSDSNDQRSIHKEKLGFDIPDGFFAESKARIRNEISKEAPTKNKTVGLRPIYAYPLAASIVLLIGITIWQFNTDVVEVENLTDVESLDFDMSTEDLLISSLMIEDAEMEEFTDAVIYNKVILEAEKNEQEMENIFINSLFVEDSLIDSYVDKKLLMEVIL